MTTWNNSESWSYDDRKKELSLIIEYTTTDITVPSDSGNPIETEEVEIAYEVDQVQLEDGKLILTQEESGEWGNLTAISIFGPKK